MVGRRVLERALERRVADQQRGLRVLAQRHVLGIGQENPDEDDRRRALGCDGHRADT